MPQGFATHNLQPLGVGVWMRDNRTELRERERQREDPDGRVGRDIVRHNYHELPPPRFFLKGPVPEHTSMAT